MSKRLYRSNRNRMLCGVCGGIAEYFDIDPALVRLGWIVFCILGGSGALAVQLLVQLGQALLGLGLQLLGLSLRLLGLGVHLLIDLFPLIHKVFDGLEQQQIQPTGENRKIEEVQQDLLPVDIQWDIHSISAPYNTKISRITTNRA